VALAARYDPDLYQRILAYPADLPDLALSILLAGMLARRA